MRQPIALRSSTSLLLQPRPPYHFDANFHKPSHFPSSDVAWAPGKAWVTMRWNGYPFGLRFEERGTTSRPKVRLTVFSPSTLSEDDLAGLVPEIRWRFNFDQDIAPFCQRYRPDEILGPAIRRWRGMKPIAANSLYETLMIYVVLQNAVIRRSIQMLEALFSSFGRKLRFDGKVLSCFWEPGEMGSATESDLRALKVGYRAKTLLRLTEQFTAGAVDEFALRKMSRAEAKMELAKLYGVGPATLEYLLYEDLYFLDALDHVPPWERKIMSRLLFERPRVPADHILRFFRARYPGYEKLAFHISGRTYSGATNGNPSNG